ncbi:site-specific integrase [Rhizobium metallidurans]|uniref:Integrase n=1 Tax=Rhizobium metallidurans TaxID=1265931 RepID=A0A7W6CR95_9HYPH|nr:site-specific integrase [Rhizobium metallidurans]MBB3965728.1 integrase [Rhizobium metallidurans]
MKNNQKLTKTVADDALPKDKRYVIWDTEIAGFGLRVYPTGSKSWILEYRPDGGGRDVDKRRLKLGTSKEITADQARKQAKLHSATATLGGDPQADKNEKRAAITVKELAHEFMEKLVKEMNAANTAVSYKDAFKHILPALGARKADGIKKRDLGDLHHALRNTPIMANKVLAVFSSMMSYGMTMDLIAKRENPAKDIKKFPENTVTRFLSVEELERLGEVLEEAETVGIPWTIDPDKKTKHVPKANQRTVASPHAVAAIRLYLLTGARLREILQLKWSSVDLNRGILKLEKAKGGPRELVASMATIDILRNLKRVGEHVIASDSAGTQSEKPRYDLKGPWSNIRAYAGLSDVRLHDLRHTFASHAVIDGTHLAVVSKLLGHKSITTTMRYAHLNDPALRQASEQIGGKMSKVMKTKG